MISAYWASAPRRALSKALWKRARKAAQKGDGVRAARIAQQALRFSPQDTKALNRVAKYLTLDVDPHGEEAHDHAGIDALLEQIGEADLPDLREDYQNIIAVSLVRRRKPVPESLLSAIVARDDDDALIIKQLAADPDVEVHRLLAPLFERHGLQAPPLIPEGAGIDCFGFPDCPPALGDKVTVAMTSFNAEQTIEHAIRSVVNQTWRNLEFFIVDDASTDATGKIIEKYAAMDDRIIPLHNPVNIGTYCSKNRALERATGRWFTCHDSDDWSHPMKIERQVEALIRTDAVANTSRWIRLGPGLSVRLAYGAVFSHPNFSSLMFQTNAVRDSLGFYDSVRISADGEMLQRLQVKFGKLGLRDEQALLSIGWIQRGALTSTEKWESTFNKVAQQRNIYKDSYLRWHRSTKSLYIPIKHEPRLFDAPEELISSLSF